MMGSADVLQVVDVVRTFDKGAFRAVDGVTFSISAGEILGLLGPNGAGKTTIVRMCSTLLAPDQGHILVKGIDCVVYPARARQHLGISMGGELGFYMRASVRDNLLFFADVAGLGRQRKREVAWALERVSLGDQASAKVDSLSRGMKQRLHLARAILGRPSLLLLDEATSGLDPEIALDIRHLVRELADSGVGVLLTSHTMAEIESLASRVAVLGAGRLHVEGQVADIARLAGVGQVSEFTYPVVSAQLKARIMRLLPSSVDVAMGEGRVRARIIWPKDSELQGHHRLAALLAEVGDVPVDLVVRPATLEEAYLGLAPQLARS